MVLIRFRIIDNALNRAAIAASIQAAAARYDAAHPPATSSESEDDEKNDEEDDEDNDVGEEEEDDDDEIPSDHGSEDSDSDESDDRILFDRNDSVEVNTIFFLYPHMCANCFHLEHLYTLWYIDS